MLQTKFTELLGCTVPLQQAGMGKIASPALAAAVANAGGLGMVSGIGAAPPEYVAKILDGLRRSTSGAFGANFIVDGVRESGKLDADFLRSWRWRPPGPRWSSSSTRPRTRNSWRSPTRAAPSSPGNSVPRPRPRRRSGRAAT